MDSRAGAVGEQKGVAEIVRSVPNEILEHIMSFFDGVDLVNARLVNRKWRNVASKEHLWEAICLKEWKSLGTDAHLWPLVRGSISRNAPDRWFKMYSLVKRHYPRWNCRLHKASKFACNVRVHQLSGSAMSGGGMPANIFISHRFNPNRLHLYVLPEAAILHFEPETEEDRNGFEKLILYFQQRHRAGLALDGIRRLMFIPPCDFARERILYHGPSMIGLVQDAVPDIFYA